MTKGAILALLLAASPTVLADQAATTTTAVQPAAPRPAVTTLIQFRSPGSAHKHWQDLRGEKHAALVRAFEQVLGRK